MQYDSCGLSFDPHTFGLSTERELKAFKPEQEQL